MPLTGQKKRDFQPYSRHIFLSICPLGCVEGTRDDFSTKTLLAGMETTAALLSIFPPPVAVKEEAPFELPFLTPAHISRSLFFFLWGEGLSVCWAVLADFSRSMIEVFPPFSFALEHIVDVAAVQLEKA